MSKTRRLAAAVAAALVFGSLLPGSLGAESLRAGVRPSHAPPDRTAATQSRDDEAPIRLVSTALAGQPPATDVDIAPDGLWLTYPNGRTELVVLARDAGGAFTQNVASRQQVIPPLRFGSDEHAVELLRAPRGWWVVTSRGAVFAMGGAPHHGDMANVELNEPVVDAAVTPSGHGYVMLGADGGVFAFGDAKFHGSVQGIVDDTLGDGHLAADHLTAPVVTLAGTRDGYWLVAADGAVFPFGDAPYFGSFQDVVNTGNQLAGITREWAITPPVADGVRLARDALDAPMISLVTGERQAGYMMLASDGGVFTYGDARFLASFAHRGLPEAVAISLAPSGEGYAVLTADGNVHLVGHIGTTPDAGPDDASASSTTSSTDASRSGDTGARSAASRQPARSTSTRSTRVVSAPSRTTTRTTVPARPAVAVQQPPVRFVSQDVSACRPSGYEGFPPLVPVELSDDNEFDVLVVFAEFPDVRRGQVWSISDMRSHLHQAKEYIEAQSYGQLDIDFTYVPDWVTVGYDLADLSSFFPLLEERLVEPRDLAWQVTLGIREQLGDDYFTARAEPFDSVLVITPPERFRDGVARNAYVPTTDDGIVTTQIGFEERIDVAPQSGSSILSASVVGSTLRDEPLAYRTQWWPVAAHELLHNLGLNDYYSYDPTRRAEFAQDDGQHVVAQFGMMGLHAVWPGRGSLLRNVVAKRSDGTQVSVSRMSTYARPRIREELAWSRWRTGWINDDDLACLDVGRSTVRLGPIAAPGDHTPAAIVPLGEHQMLVLENRSRLGYDADTTTRLLASSPLTASRVLGREGLLAYVVDSRVTDGNVPIRMVGDDGTGLIPQSPIVRPGEGFRLAGDDAGPVVEVDVAPRNAGETLDVNISWQAPSTAAPAYDFEVTWRSGGATGFVPSPQAVPQPVTSTTAGTPAGTTTSTSPPTQTTTTTTSAPAPTTSTSPAPATSTPSSSSSTSTSTSAVGQSTSTTTTSSSTSTTTTQPRTPTGTSSTTTQPAAATTTTQPEPEPPSTMTQPPEPEPGSPVNELVERVDDLRAVQVCESPLRGSERRRVTTTPRKNLSVLVAFLEFPNRGLVNNDELWPMRDLRQQVNDAKDYIEAQSYRNLELDLTFIPQWLPISLGTEFPTEREFIHFDAGYMGTLATLAIQDHVSSDFFDDTKQKYDTLLVITPPDSFFASDASSEPIGIPAADGAGGFASSSISTASLVGSAGRSERVQHLQHDWWPMAARELMNNLGLNYYFPGNIVGRVDRDASAWGYMSGTYGAMGLEGMWVWPEHFRRTQMDAVANTFDGMEVRATIDHDITPHALEELVWARWRMNWMAHSQVGCVHSAHSSAPSAVTLRLAPITDKGRNRSALFVRLGRDLLVLENRTRAGYDADRLLDAGDAGKYSRVLQREGLLPYLVRNDSSRAGLPVSILGDDGTGWIGRDPIVSPGGGFTLTEWVEGGIRTGLSATVDVLARDDDGSLWVQVSTRGLDDAYRAGDAHRYEVQHRGERASVLLPAVSRPRPALVQ